MIVLDKLNAQLFGEQKAPVGIYQPIEIKGGLWVLPDEAEALARALTLQCDKRKVLESEWIKNEGAI